MGLTHEDPVRSSCQVPIDQPGILAELVLADVRELDAWTSQARTLVTPSAEPEPVPDRPSKPPKRLVTGEPPKAAPPVLRRHRRPRGRAAASLLSPGHAARSRLGRRCRLCPHS